MAEQSYKPLRRVYRDWEFKKRCSSLELSNLQPFIDLYAIFNDEDTILKNKDISTSLNSNEAIDLELLIDDSSPKKKYTAYKIGALETQINEFKTASFAEPNFSGGVGIEQLNVTKSTSESFNIRFSMNLLITNVKIIQDNPQYASLLTMGCEFILVYGWTNVNDLPFYKGVDIYTDSDFPSNPPAILESSNGRKLTIDLRNSSRNGFWTSNFLKLYKYNFEFTPEGYLRYDCNFITETNFFLLFTKSGIIKSDVEAFLKPDKYKQSQIAQNTVSLDDVDIETKRSEIINRIRETKSDVGNARFGGYENEWFITKGVITEEEENAIDARYAQASQGVKTQKQSNEVKEKIIAEKEAIRNEKLYIKLGIAIELIRYSLIKNGIVNDDRKLRFRYTDISDRLKKEIVNLVKIRKIKYETENTGAIAPKYFDSYLNSQRSLENIFDVYLPIDFVTDSVQQSINQTSLSILDVMKNIIYEGTKTTLPGISILVRHTDDDFIELMVSAIDDKISGKLEDNRVQETLEAAIQLNYRTKDTLIYSFRQSSKNDPVAFETMSLGSLFSQNVSSQFITALQDVLRNTIGRGNTITSVNPDLRALLPNEDVRNDLVRFLQNDPVIQASSGKSNDFNSISTRSTVARFISDNNSGSIGSFIATILLQSNPDSKSGFNINQTLLNFLAFYLRESELNIHGICNLQSYNLLRISGVVPGLNNAYHLTKDVNETINKQKFETMVTARMYSESEKETLQNEIITPAVQTSPPRPSNSVSVVLSGDEDTGENGENDEELLQEEFEDQG